MGIRGDMTAVWDSHGLIHLCAYCVPDPVLGPELGMQRTRNSYPGSSGDRTHVLVVREESEENFEASAWAAAEIVTFLFETKERGHWGLEDPPSWITALLWRRGLHSSLKL